MRTFSTNFREALRNVKQINAFLTYQLDGDTYVLITEDEKELLTEDGSYLFEVESNVRIQSNSLLRVNPIVDTELLKSTCKGLNVDSKINIPIGTEIKCQIGVLVGSEYEYMDFGYYYVKTSTYQEDTNSYLLECYDAIIKSNISYDDNPLSITFPCTVGDLITAIATKIGLSVNLDDTTEIMEETISTDVWHDLGLNYRDILDDLSAIVGNIMVDNSNTLINIYPKTHSITNELITDRDMADVNINIDKMIVLNHLKINSNGITLIDNTDNTSISNYGEFIFEINNNRLLSAYSSAFASYVWGAMLGITYYVCDINTNGLLIFEPFDQFSIYAGEGYVPTMLLQDDIEITQGITERIGAEDIKSTNMYQVVDKTQNQLNNAETKINNATISIDEANAQVVLKANSDGNMVTCALDADADTGTEFTIEALDEANAQILLKADSNGNLVTCRLDADADTGSSFSVKADDIDLSGKTISLTSDNINIESTNFSVDEDGNMTANSGDIGGFTLSDEGFSNTSTKTLEFTSDDKTRVQQIMLGNITATDDDYDKYDLDNNGKINSLDYIRISKFVNGSLDADQSATYTIDSQDPIRCLKLYDNNLSKNSFVLGKFGSYFENLSAESAIITTILSLRANNSATISMNAEEGSITCVSLTQTSLEESKKNIEKYNKSALDEVLNTDIYTYNFNLEDDDHKKHIGFVIGENRNYSNDITSVDKDNNVNGADIYSFVSVCCKAIQEQQEQIEELKKEVQKLKEEK